MGFPITVNGRTWNLSDFQNGGYHANLGRFLSDCLAAERSVLVANSASAITMATGSQTFTLGGDPDTRHYVAGMQVRIADIVNPTEIWMVGYVTAYAGNTLTVEVTAYCSNGSPVGNWWISPSQTAVNVTSFPYGSGGSGTGGTTVATARAYSFPDSYMEDFCGYGLEHTSTTTAPFIDYWVTCAGAGTFSPYGNSGAVLNPATGVTGVTDPNRPGVAVLTAQAVGSVATVASSYQKQIYFPYLNPSGTNPPAYGKVAFYLPRLLSVADQFYIKVGLDNGDGQGVLNDAGIKGMIVEYGTQVPVSSVAGLNVFKYRIFTNTAIVTILGTTEVIPGLWYTYKMVSYGQAYSWPNHYDIRIWVMGRNPNTGEIEFFEEAGGFDMEGVSGIEMPAMTVDGMRYRLFAGIEKVTGSTKSELYVDYLFFNASGALLDEYWE